MKFVQVPFENLEPATLGAVVDEYILREGTDYGHSDVTLGDKRIKLNTQIARGDVVLVFDTEEESCTLMKKNEFEKNGG